jgi:hypothetical protein
VEEVPLIGETLLLSESQNSRGIKNAARNFEANRLQGSRFIHAGHGAHKGQRKGRVLTREGAACDSNRYVFGSGVRILEMHRMSRVPRQAVIDHDPRSGSKILTKAPPVVINDEFTIAEQINKQAPELPKLGRGICNWRLEVGL